MIIISVIIVLANALLAGIYTAVGGGGSIIVTLSNLLFIEGGIILLLGAIVEFFHIAGRDDRMVVSTRVIFPFGGKDNAGSGDLVELKNPGWLVIFLGGLLLVYSITFVLVFAR